MTASCESTSSLFGSTERQRLKQRFAVIWVLFIPRDELIRKVYIEKRLVVRVFIERFTVPAKDSQLNGFLLHVELALMQRDCGERFLIKHSLRGYFGTVQFADRPNQSVALYAGA
jgi:hypothetical protein